MKRFALAGGLALACILSLFAYAANITPTPIVGPTETGENSLSSQQIVDMARIKLGFGTVTIPISASAGTGTLNNAAGIVTLTSATAGASFATPTVVTLNNSKIQTTDYVQCGVDNTGITAGAFLYLNCHIASAGVLTITVYDLTATPMTASTVLINFEVVTSGNPN